MTHSEVHVFAFGAFQSLASLALPQGTRNHIFWPSIFFPYILCTLFEVIPLSALSLLSSPILCSFWE